VANHSHETAVGGSSKGQWLFCQRFRLAWLQGRFPAPVLPGERTGPLLRDWLPASLTKWSGPRGGGLLLQGSGRSVPDSV